MTKTKVKKVRVEYAPTPGSKFNSRQSVAIGTELDRICEQHGCLKPQCVVSEARPDSSPLHEFFTWSNTKAADLWRLEEARHIIRSVRVIQVGTPEQEQPVVRAFLNVNASDTETRFEGRAYIPVMRVCESSDYRQQVLNAAKKELTDWQHRYEDLREHFTQVFTAIDDVSK